MADKSEKDPRIETGDSRQEQIKKLEADVDAVNAEIKKFNDIMVQYEKTLFKKYGIKPDIKKVEQFKMGLSIEFEVRDKNTGEIKEKKIINDV